jgi:hypothetical protein
MSNIQTQKSRFPSKYSPGQFVTGAQYIIELLCERKAQLEGKTLVIQFWKQKEWAAFFRSQTNTCNKLIQEYDAIAIIRALTRKERDTTYSLRSPWILPIIKEEQEKYNKEKEIIASLPKVEKAEAVEFKERPQQRGKIDKLLELDG